MTGNLDDGTQTAILAALAQWPAVVMIASVALSVLLLVGGAVAFSHQARLAHEEQHRWVFAGWSVAATVMVLAVVYGLWWLLVFAWRGIWS